MRGISDARLMLAPEYVPSAKAERGARGIGLSLRLRDRIGIVPVGIEFVGVLVHRLIVKHGTANYLTQWRSCEGKAY